MPGFSLANQLLHLLIGGWALVVATGTLIAEEGGTGHYAPGSLATLIDLPPTQPGWVVQPLFLHYEGEASRSRVFPIAGAITAGLNAKSDVFAVGATYTIEPKILGAYYSVGAYLPFAETEVSASVLWKSGSWQYSALAQVYAPTGSYEVGRLANLGLNYWTLDTTVGVTYSDEPSGFNFSVLSGITLNSENKATNYRSGSVVHVEASVQQLFKHGDALIGIGANGFIYEQVTADSGAGAVLGSFKGRTGGIGPVVSYIRPLGTTTLALELRWLPELYAERRLQGDSIWFKGVLDF
jgi:hypothetical protein